MEQQLKYGDTSTYQFFLDDLRMDWLTSLTNRSNGQTQFLFNLVGGDFEKLMQLEMQLKNCVLFYSPTTLAEVEHILSLTPIADFLQLTLLSLDLFSTKNKDKYKDGQKIKNV